MIADFMISGEWLAAFVLALVPAIGAVWIKAKRAGMKQAGEITVKSPVPTVPIERTYTPPTFSQHQEVVRRVKQLEEESRNMREHVDNELRAIRKENGETFVKLMEAGEARKDMIFDKIDSMARGFHARVDALVSNKPKGTH